MSVIKKVLDELTKKTKVYEAKPSKDEPKKPISSSTFKEEQHQLEKQLLKLKEEGEKKNALESIVVNSEVVTTDKTFEELERQQFHKQFEGVKGVYKADSHHKTDGEHNPNDAYNSGHSHDDSHHHNYHSEQKNVYKN